MSVSHWLLNVFPGVCDKAAARVALSFSHCHPSSCGRLGKFSRTGQKDSGDVAALCVFPVGTVPVLGGLGIHKKVFQGVLKLHQEVMEASSHPTFGRVKRGTSDCKGVQAAFSGSCLSLLFTLCLEKGGFKLHP